VAAETLNIQVDPASQVLTLMLRPLPSGTPLVVLNRALLSAIDAALNRITSGEFGTIKGFVLASDSRVFIAGADLKEIMGLSDPELHEYLKFGQKVYGRIATLPCTTVAAINGAALGGGLEIAMHCDCLIAAEPPSGTPEKPMRPYLIGLPEAGLSICPGWGGTNLLPARMDAARAIEMTALGKPFSVLEAREAGLVEELVPPDALLASARKRASAPKNTPRNTPRCIADPDRLEDVRAGLAVAQTRIGQSQAALAVIDCIQTGLDRGWHAALDAEREHLVRLRNTPEGRGAIEAFFAKSEKK